MADAPHEGAPPEKEAAARLEGPEQRRQWKSNSRGQYSKKPASHQQKTTIVIPDDKWFKYNPNRRYRVRRVLPDDFVFYLLGARQTANMWIAVWPDGGFRTLRLVTGGADERLP